MFNFLLVGLGGFFGCIARYGITKVFAFAGFLPVSNSTYNANSINFNHFPIATLVSNIIAGFAIGFLFGLEEKFVLNPNVKLGINTGVLGGLSTFSTFSIENILFLQNREYGFAAINIIANLVLCFSATAFGFFIAKLVK